ncbi:MAG: polyhydroxyalkanoic acid system family protein [Pseudomonadota bacterium]
MSRPVTVTIEHSKTIEDAKKRIDEGIAELTGSLAGKMAIKIDKHWEGDTLHFAARAMMQKLSGTADVFPQHVRITVVLPDILAGMAEKVTEKIQKKGTLMLEDRSG